MFHVKEIRDTHKMEDNPTNSLISLQDFEAYYKKNYGSNCPPYTSAVLDNNNLSVSRFVKEILTPRAKNGKVRATDAAHMLELWLHGHWTREEMQAADMIPQPTAEQLKYWLDLFNQDIKELVKVSPTKIAAGFSILMGYHDYWILKGRYDEIFKDDDFNVWYKKAGTKFRLFTPDGPKPFDIKDISDKAMTIIKFKLDVR